MPSDPAPAQPLPSKSDLIAAPELYRAVLRFVQTRVPRAEAEDIVQSTLADALESETAPANPDELRRWILGIARHKVVDWFRRNQHETKSGSLEDVPGDPAPEGADDLLRWVERELPEGGESPKTLEWMMREAGGDKLETIAREEQLPAPRVRQRVSRLRRHLRSRWLVQAGVAAAVTGIVLFVLWRLSRPQTPEIARETPPPPPSTTPRDPRQLREERGRTLRRAALEQCRDQKWQPCLDGLDQARQFDPRGDTAAEIQQARQDAAAGLLPPPVPVPSSSAPKPPRPRPTIEPSKAPTLMDSDSPLRAPKRPSKGKDPK